MKINKIYISAFGGLKDFTLELDNGLNIIYGENENGKSTVMAFIKAMFYGTGKKSQQLANSMRQKYTPWSGETMGGRIYFEADSHNYCLEREFRTSDSTDRVTLTDTDSGESTQVTSDIGQRFFGVGAAAFERSMFIGSCAFSGNIEAEGELNLKLSNLAFTGDEDTSYPTVAKRLEAARNKLISKSGKAGSCVEDIRKHNDITERLQVADRNAQRKIEINEALSSLEVEYKKLYAEHKEINALLESENDVKNAEKLQEYLDTKAQLDELNKTLALKDGDILDGNFVKKIEFILNQIEKLSERTEELKGDIARIEDSIKLQNESSPEDKKKQIIELNNNLNSLTAELDRLESNAALVQKELNAANEQKNSSINKKKPFNPIILPVSIVAIIVAIVLLNVNITASIGATAVAVVLILLTFILRPLDKSALIKAENQVSLAMSRQANIKSEQLTVKEQMNNITAKMNLLSSMLNSDNAVKAQREAELKERQDALSAENEKLTATKQQLITLYGKLSDETDVQRIRDSLATLTEKADTQKQIKLRLNYLSQDLGGISYETAAEKLTAIDKKQTDTGVDFTAVREKAAELADRLSAMRDDITSKQTELKTAFRNAENPEDLKRELAALKEAINAKKAYCDALDIALKVMESSFHEVRRSYGTEVERLTLDIFRELTGGRYSSVSVSKSLDMSVEQTDVFGTREIGYLSQGTIDQAYLSLRLAVSRLISDGATIPVMLDDSLSQYDDKRTQTAMEFLNKYSADNQAVMFTCHGAIADAANKCGITVKKPFTAK